MRYKAAILDCENDPLEIETVKYKRPKWHEVVIKAVAVSAGPLDNLQKSGQVPDALLQDLPAVLGQDVAGEVYQVGSKVTKFKPGDRVIAHCANGGAFQEYVTVKQDVMCVIPEVMKYQEACTIPLSVSTASHGLYGILELNQPTMKRQHNRDKAVLIWGGATSVGCQAIQLARASGYYVVCTASRCHFNYLKELGADDYLDYNVMTVVMNVMDALKGLHVVGAINCTTQDRSIERCEEILKRMEGKKTLAMVDVNGTKRPDAKVINSDLHQTPLAKAIFSRYLPKALERGKFIPAPPSVVIGHGLEHVNRALEFVPNARCQKVVVTLGG